MSALSNPRNLPDANPVPDLNRKVSRVALRERLLAAGQRVAPDATRDEMEPIFRRLGIPMEGIVRQAQVPEYRRAEPPPVANHVDVKAMTAAQLKAYCRSIDPNFKPGLKAQRQVYLAWLYGKGLITEGQAFKGE